MTVPVPPQLPDIQAILKTPPEQLPRNKVTDKAHRDEVWWQIMFPLLIACLLALGAGVMVCLTAYSGNSASPRVWADISAAFIIVQVLVMLLPLLIVLIGLAFGVGWILGKLPPYFKVAQDYSIWLAYKTDWAMKFVTGPVLQIRASVAGMDGFIQGIRKFFGQ